MAISATFVARFDSFFEQVSKAEARLGEFSMSSEQTQKSLDRLAKSFSGDKLIADATLVAKAIESIGGSSNLTEKEAARVNAQMTEALAKMKALGLEASPAMRKLADDTAYASKSASGFGGVLEGLKGTARELMTSFAALFAVQQLASFAKSVVDLGGELTDLSSKTGIGTTALQEFKYAGSQVGVSLDTITGAVNKLQVRLAGDDKSAAAAVETLGLSMDSLKAMKPEDQFKAIADKIGAIEDPMLRTKAAVDLFGKSGSELLPVLSKEFGDLTERANSLGIVMDEQTVAAMDNLGDTVSDLGGVAMAALGKVITPLLPLLSGLAKVALELASVLGDVLGFVIGNVVAGFKLLANVALDMTRSILSGLKSLADSIPGFDKMTGAGEKLAWALGQVDSAQKSLNTTTPEAAKQTNAVAVAHEGAAKSASKYKTEADKIAEAMQKATEAAIPWHQTLLSIDGTVVEAVKYYAGMGASIGDLRTAYGLTEAQMKAIQVQMDIEKKIAAENASVVAGLTVEISKLGTAYMDVLPAAQTLASRLPPMMQLVSQKLPDATFGEKFSQVLQTKLPTAIMSAIEGGGNIFKAAGSTIGSWLTSDDGAGKTIKGGLMKVLPDGLGKAFGSLVPGIGALAGPLVGALGGFIAGKLFKSAGKETNDLRDKFVAAAGGLGALNERAHEAGLTLDKLLDAKKPEAYKAAVAELEAAFKFQDEAMKTLDETVQKYGFSIEQLGPAFARQELGKKAQELYQDFQVLTSAGIPLDNVIQQMSGSINEFVQHALLTGTEVPSAMRPMIEKMIEMGQLTDASGNAITSLESSGLTFSETMTQGFQKIVDSVTKLTDAIARGLGLAIEKVPDVDVDVRLNPTWNDLPNFPDPQPFALGTKGVTGSWFKNFGAGTPAMLHGNEAVVRADQMDAFAAAAGGGEPGVLDEIRGLRSDLMALPLHMSRAVRDAILLA